ncbi:MAG: ATP-binding protein [Leptolyngbyaceae cyanobacterium bins.349]|nr:ATP-binding protein [Leptolyngbyaceae cyanobacterium bins.349]
MSEQYQRSPELGHAKDAVPLQLLIVEDRPEDAELIVLALQEANFQFTYQVIETLDQFAALLQSQSWDVVLSDFRLPQANAYAVLQVLQQQQLDLPLILVTGTLGEEAAVDCIKAGVTDYVLKEHLFRLPMVLQRSLREYRLRRQQQAAMQQIQQQATRETLVNRIVQAMRGTLIFEEVLQTTANRLHEALGSSRCLIFLPNQAQQMVSQYVSHLTRNRENLLGIQCPLFQYFEQELTRGQLVQLECMTNLGEAVQQFADAFEIQAMLMIPLVYQEIYQGGICVHQCDRERPWTVDEIALVKAIADHCAIALYQTQLFRHAQQQAQREQLLNQISRDLNSSLDPDYILQGIVKMIGECFKVDRAFIFALAAGQVRVTHEWRLSDQIVPMLGIQVAVADWLGLVEPQTNQYFSQPVHLPDSHQVQLNEAQQECVKLTQRKSLLSVPVFVRDQFFGGIELHTTGQRRQFTQDEISLLQQLADQAAIALYNAQSYERLEELVQARTQELEAEKHLSDAANRAKSEFLANMSHELRTPLTSILGFSSVLLKQVFGPLNEKQIQYLDNIFASGEHLLELINDLLDLSKIEAGREELTLEQINVEEMCDVCVEVVREQISSKGLTLNYDVPAAVTCIADRRRLKQILLNLLSNAVKFTDTGFVSLKVDLTGDRLQFAIADTGIGIDPNQLSQLFQPFHQVQSGLDRIYQGTGLGLALARKLAQLHGGTITVSSALGVGSCFTLDLPLVASAGVVHHALLDVPSPTELN